MKYLFIIFLLTFSVCAFTQQDTMFVLTSGKCEMVLGPKRVDSLFFPPVVYHDSTSKLPDTLLVEGIVVETSPGACGKWCAGGVAKVRLTKPIAGYPDSLAYLVTACLSKHPARKVINVRASKLKRNETQCYYQSIFNLIDSKGTPFYKLSEGETRKIE